MAKRKSNSDSEQPVESTVDEIPSASEQVEPSIPVAEQPRPEPRQLPEPPPSPIAEKTIPRFF